MSNRIVHGIPFGMFFLLLFAIFGNPVLADLACPDYLLVRHNATLSLAAAITIPKTLKPSKILVWSVREDSSTLLLKRRIKKLLGASLVDISLTREGVIGLSESELFFIPYLNVKNSRSLRPLGKFIRYSSMKASPDGKSLILLGELLSSGAKVVQLYKISPISGLFERVLNYNFKNIQALHDKSVVEIGFDSENDKPYALFEDVKGAKRYYLDIKAATYHLMGDSNDVQIDRRHLY